VAGAGPPRPDLWLRPSNGAWVNVSGDAGAFPPGTRSAIGYAVAALPMGGFVAVASDDDVGRSERTVVWTSPDGRRWHQEPTDPSLDEARIETLRPWKGGLVGAGTVPGGQGAQAAVWTTTDGRAWQRSTSFPGAPGGERIQQVTDAADAGGGLIAVGITYSPENGINAHAWFSTDGTNWDRSTEPAEWSLPGSDQLFQAVCHTSAGMVALGYARVGNDKHVWAWTTKDGHTWTRATGPAAAPLADAHGGVGGCRSAGTGVVAGGSVSADHGDDAAVWASPDGLTWRRIDAPSLFGGGGPQGVADVAVDGPRLVAVGQDGDDAAVWVSDDSGRHWRRASGDLGSLGGYGDQIALGVTVDAGRALLIGDDGPAVALWQGDLTAMSR